MSVKTQEAAAAAGVSWMMFSRMQRVRTLCWRSTLSAIAIVIRGVVVGAVIVIIAAAGIIVVVVGVVVVIFSHGFSSKNSSEKET